MRGSYPDFRSYRGKSEILKVIGPENVPEPCAFEHVQQSKNLPENKKQLEEIGFPCLFVDPEEQETT